LRIGGADEHVRPGEGARYQQQTAPPEVGLAFVVLHHVQSVSVEGDRGMQAAEELGGSSSGDLVEAELQVSLKQRTYPGPVWRERDLPVAAEFSDDAAQRLLRPASSPRNSARPCIPGPC
jgi:hypothetical protein